jgi:hypothetical protein
MSSTPEREKQLDELVMSDEAESCSADEEADGSPVNAATEATSTDARAAAHDLAHSMRMAKKCTSDWSNMHGADAIRQCGRCRLLVVKTQDLTEENLSKMLFADEEILRRSGTNPLTALQVAKRNGLFRRTDGAITIGDCYSKRVPRPVTTAIWFALPFAPGLLNFLLAPGYLFPFLNHPMARVVLLAFVAWNFLGAWFFSRTSNRLLQVLIVLFFTTPLVGAFVLGPAVFTIMQAIGPSIIAP